MPTPTARGFTPAGSMEPGSSAEVREHLVEALNLDLIGPWAGHAHAGERLPGWVRPSNWYLTGFLIPSGTDPERSADADEDDDLDETPASGGLAEESAEERRAAKKGFFPSSMGLSFLVAREADALAVIVRWGDYERAEAEDADGKTVQVWQRRPNERTIRVPLSRPGEPQTGALRAGDSRAGEPQTGAPRTGDSRTGEPRAGALQTGDSRTDEPRAGALQTGDSRADDPQPGAPPEEHPEGHPVPDSNGLRLHVVERPISIEGRTEIPAGTRSVSVFLVNRRRPDRDDPDLACAFQAEIEVRGERAFVPRPNLRGARAEDWDEQVADLHYADTPEYATGHGVSADWEVVDGACRKLRTAWIPSADVEETKTVKMPGAELSMDALGALPNGRAAEAALRPLVDQYRAWIASRRGDLSASVGARNETSDPASGERGRALSTHSKPIGARHDTATELLRRAGVAADRMEHGIAMLASDTAALDAFRVANRAVARALRQRFPERFADGPPRWRAFQLAFILLNVPGLTDPRDPDRETVDLLFFPTGGGKTEAYLGLAAFAMVLRRLRHPEWNGLQGAGVSVIMRYTLRLLTLDQLARASGLVCALELEREAAAGARYGEWPFEIGLWVGKAATPNLMGRKGDGRSDSARARTRQFKADPGGKPSPIPLENCPWCGTRFEPASFTLLPNDERPAELRIVCANFECDFSGDRPLPVLAVDEPIYRRLPAFLIATVDKFASLPWVAETGKLLGGAERFNAGGRAAGGGTAQGTAGYAVGGRAGDAAGFYGAAEPRAGRRLDRPLPPPDLVIQDELHLISGPLGTMVGLYEAAIEALCVRDLGDAFDGGLGEQAERIRGEAPMRHGPGDGPGSGLGGAFDGGPGEQAERIRGEAPMRHGPGDGLGSGLDGAFDGGLGERAERIRGEAPMRHGPGDGPGSDLGGDPEHRAVRPKIVASTATVRQAQDQIQALFARSDTRIFPPPGPDRRDSFFARTVPVERVAGRRYLGITSPGRSPKVLMRKAWLALMGAAERAYREAGGHANHDNPADPYMTVLGYFNSLRELGGARRILEEEVQNTIKQYGERRRFREPRGLFHDRRTFSEVMELTSRVSTDKVAAARRRLECAFHEPQRVDCAIATNMISVGLDIPRLGLMVVLNQPKTHAEYIQATSRVGRDDRHPGLVVTLLNAHKPRDRSHYERFRHYHETFYRSVEVSSVTPFSARALDRGFAGALVGLARHAEAKLTSPEGVERVADVRAGLERRLLASFRERVERQSFPDDAERVECLRSVRSRVADLLDAWRAVVEDYHAAGVAVRYQQYEPGSGRPLLREMLDTDFESEDHRKFRANRSLRDVEPEVDLYLREPSGREVGQ